MIIPARKYRETFEVCKEYPDDLMAYGYFEGDNIDDLKLVCKTTERYEQLKRTGKENLVMKVAKRTSYFMLALTLLSPLYISLNTEDGAEECEKIFNDDFHATEDVLSARNSGKSKRLFSSKLSSSQMI